MVCPRPTTHHRPQSPPRHVGWWQAGGEQHAVGIPRGGDMAGHHAGCGVGHECRCHNRCGPRYRRHVRHGPCRGNPPVAGVIVRIDVFRHCGRNHLNGHEPSGDRPGGAQHSALPHRQAAAQPRHSTQPGHDLKHRRHRHENRRRSARNHWISRHDDWLSHRRDHRYRPHIPDDRPAAARGCATDRRRRGTHREAHHQGIRGPPPGRGRTFWTCYRRRPRLSRGQRSGGGRNHPTSVRRHQRHGSRRHGAGHAGVHRHGFPPPARAHLPGHSHHQLCRLARPPGGDHPG